MDTNNEIQALDAKRCSRGGEMRVGILDPDKS